MKVPFEQHYEGRVEVLLQGGRFLFLCAERMAWGNEKAYRAAREVAVIAA